MQSSTTCRPVESHADDDSLATVYTVWNIKKHFPRRLIDRMQMMVNFESVDRMNAKQKTNKSPLVDTSSRCIFQPNTKLRALALTSLLRTSRNRWKRSVTREACKARN